MKWLFREPARDPRLGAALRQLERGSGRDDTELRQGIVTAARPQLDALRSRQPRWWEWISRWMPVAVPLGLAASLLAGLILPGTEEITPSSSLYSAEPVADSTLLSAAYSEGPTGSQLAANLVAPGEGDWLLEEAVTQ
jgi:hypothetical protein